MNKLAMAAQSGAATMTYPDWSYSESFSRTIGWVNENELDNLRGKRIAIAGMGGVGGAHLLTLVRLGVGSFCIADFDGFELANFNRQVGATVSNLNRSKVEVMAEMATDINPTVDVRSFSAAIDENNVETFLQGVDLYLDSLDFFAVKARRTLFATCDRLGIPVITAAPLGMGCAMLNFLPGRMSFEQYFRVEGCEESEQLLRFLVGLAPARLHSRYLLDPLKIDLVNHGGPSTPMAVNLCAGMAGSHALKILLNRGPVPAAPWGLHFDAYRNKLVRTWRPGGNRHPLQRLALMLGRRIYLKKWRG